MLMRIRVLLFGQLKDLIGRGEDYLELQPGSPLSEVLAHYGRRFPRFETLASSIACSVNQEYASAATVLSEGDEVGLLPPVSGGKDEQPGNISVKKPETLRSLHCAIVHGAIDSAAIRTEIARPEDGAVVMFDGVVRNNSHGRRTLFLDYEAYDSMAVNEMERLSQAALECFKVRDLRMVHRLGKLEIGETSIAIAVASAHRAAAFDACRWLIDTLKKTVPIWKKEHFEDGAVWADGEPFPDAIKAQK